MACDTLSTNDIVISIMLSFVEVIVQKATLDPHGAKLEDLRVQAVSQGVEWLRIALSQIRKEELRALATAANVVTHGPGRKWLTTAQLCSELVNGLMPATQARMYSLFDVFFESVIDMKETFFWLGSHYVNCMVLFWLKFRSRRSAALALCLKCRAPVGRRRTTRKSRRRLLNWKISVYKRLHRVLSGFVSLCRRFIRRRFGLWPLLQG